MIDYTDTLKNLINNVKSLDSNDHRFLKNISYPFIPHFEDKFYQTKNKVLIVGQETRGWLNTLINLLNNEVDTSEIIVKSKNAHEKLYYSDPKRSRFHQYLKKLKITNNNDYIQWLNFYLCDYQNKSFNNLNNPKTGNEKLFQSIRDLSIQNLSMQINTLNPKVIFFAGKYHNNYPLLQKALNVQKEEIELTTSDLNMQIWNNNILVFRIPHPAARFKGANKTRSMALHYFDQYNQIGNLQEFLVSIKNDRLTS